MARVGWKLWVCVCLLAVAGCDDGEDPAPELPDAAAPDAADPDARQPDAAGPRRCVRDDQCAAGTYCGTGAAGSQCVEGCRTAPDSCRAADRFTVCDPDSRACVPAACAGDTDCPAGTRCEAEVCVDGCRSAPDSCRPDVDGALRACDPETFECRRLVPCCEGESCSMGFDDACAGDVIAATLSCRPSPCGPPCEDDAGCLAGTYCSVDGRCIDGCRPELADECPPDTACDPDLRRCVQSACRRDRDCPDWMYCGPAGLCLTGCRVEGDNCPGETRCGPNHRCGAACVDDASCGEGAYCDALQSLCRTRCAPETHAGCGPGERCDDGRCVAGCADDPADIDGDDTPAGAPAVEWQPGAVESARFDDRVACPADADVLEVDGPRVEATLRYDTADGVLALRLVDAAGAVLAEDASSGSPKRLRLDAPRAFVVVEGLGNARPVPYRLDLRRVEAGGCFPDDRDPGDDRVDGALRVGQRPQPAFTDTVSGAACPGDADWVCFDMAAADGLEATLLPAAGCPGLEAGVYVADEARAGGEARHTLTPDGARLRFAGDPGRGLFADGEWCVRVANPGEAACEDYTLALSFQRRGQICADDLEPDDRPEDALVLDGDGPLADAGGRLPYGLGQPLLEAPRLCPGDLDLFRFTASAGDGLQAWLVADGPGADRLYVTFVDAAGAPRGSPGSATAIGAPTDPGWAVAASNGPVYVQVGGEVAEGVDYTLFVQRDRGDGTCPQDGWENVDFRDDTGLDAQRPRDIAPGRVRVEGAALCRSGGPDEDWYRVPIESTRTRVCVDADFRHDDGNIDVQVFRVPDRECRAVGGEVCCASAADCDEGLGCAGGFCRAPLVVGNSRSDDEVIDIEKTLIDVTDDLLVRVFRDPADRPMAGAPPPAYALTITRAPEDPDNCAPDWRERAAPNDNRANATPLGSARRALCDAWICDDERAVGDWYVVQVPAGTDRTAYIDFDAGEGRLLLTAIDPLRDPERIVESVQRQADVQCINLRGAGEDRTVLLQVSADFIEPGGDARVDYGLRIEPTDLRLRPRGACDELSGGVFPDIEWPRLDL